MYHPQGIPVPRGASRLRDGVYGALPLPQEERHSMTLKRSLRVNAMVPMCLAALVMSTVAAGARELRNDGVAVANPRFDLIGQLNGMAPGYSLQLLARGAAKLENPSGVIIEFGYLNDFPPETVEATKTEPDENTYLILDHNPGGPTTGFDYGRHFLFQGHELGRDLAHITRVNLDVADPRHRITLLTPVGADGKTHFNSIDGSAWNPSTRTLLFTQEAAGTIGGVIEIGADWGSTARTLYGSLGHAGYEGIHPDDQGNLLVIEDVGGTSVNVNPTDPASAKAARVPNSFVYRFVPTSPGDLTAGKLQALQVTINGQPLVYVNVDATHPTGDAFSGNQLKLHTPGTSWPVKWVTVHDTAVDGAADFDANAAAKAAGATPFKRPENAQFLPGSGFLTFFFDPTGDTSTVSGNVAALAARGAWGSIFRVDLDPSRDTGKLSIFYLGDSEHAAFDNLTFANAKYLLATEDRGDSLHKQLNQLDSVWAFDVTNSKAAPVRLIALGRDSASTVDAHLSDAATPGYQNEGDNEPTGLHVSDGDPTLAGLIGSHEPGPSTRWFITQQHGLNRVYEIAGDHDLQ
jgi:hypothetical protein